MKDVTFNRVGKSNSYYLIDGNYYITIFFHIGLKRWCLTIDKKDGFGSWLRVPFNSYTTTLRTDKYTAVFHEIMGENPLDRIKTYLSAHYDYNIILPVD